MSVTPEPIRAALARLQVQRLVFGIHQSAFPAGTWDAGYGAPASRAGRELLDFVATLGFNTVQLGPDGQVADQNPSPYDGTAFARNLLQLDLASLTELDDGRWLSPDALAPVFEALPAPDPRRADPRRARDLVRAALLQAHTHFATAGAGSPLSDRLARFRREQEAWLDADALFEVMAERIGHDDPTRFDPAVQAMLAPTAAARERRSAMGAVLAPALERVALSQCLCASQASDFRAHARSRGVDLFGDLQVGWSHRDQFLRADAFSPGWLLGAPPSRTNPEGQPWGYPLLDPDQLHDPHSPAMQLFGLRLAKTFEAYDGLRVDHPHGLVCPWIYRAETEDALQAVQAGARAFESPDVDDPDLQRWAIARPEDLNPTAASRWAEDWVKTLDDAQVARWSRLFDHLVATAARRGGASHVIAAEVLSTCPVPLARVLARHGLGRFRVTQKANVEDPDDVYRTDHAEPNDWVMLGNHDTETIFTLAVRWLMSGEAKTRAAYLAARLEREPSQRDKAVKAYCRSPGALVQAHLADLFLSHAGNVFVYFTDLFGELERFNRPGVVHPDNWTLRVPPDFAARHDTRLARGEALDINAALAMALRARGDSEDLARALTRSGYTETET